MFLMPIHFFFFFNLRDFKNGTATGWGLNLSTQVGMMVTSQTRKLCMSPAIKSRTDLTPFPIWANPFAPPLYPFNHFISNTLSRSITLNLPLFKKKIEWPQEINWLKLQASESTKAVAKYWAINVCVNNCQHQKCTNWLLKNNRQKVTGLHILLLAQSITQQTVHRYTGDYICE